MILLKIQQRQTTSKYNRGEQQAIQMNDQRMHANLSKDHLKTLHEILSNNHPRCHIVEDRIRKLQRRLPHTIKEFSVPLKIPQQITSTIPFQKQFPRGNKNIPFYWLKRYTRWLGIT